MSLVRFYACEGDPLRVALKLVLKAREQRQQVRLCGDTAQLQRLSALMWSEPGFIAHAGPGTAPTVQARSPITLGGEPAAADVLINLGDALDCSAVQAARVFEIVGPDDAARAAGRQRFRRHEQVRGQRPEHVRVPA
jgi:DNA polymerase IIIc chi subunit